MTLIPFTTRIMDSGRLRCARAVLSSVEVGAILGGGGESAASSIQVSISDLTLKTALTLKLAFL